MHLTEVALEAASARGAAAASELALAPLRAWFEALLEPRPGWAAVQAPPEPEPEPEPEGLGASPAADSLDGGRTSELPTNSCQSREGCF